MKSERLWRHPVPHRGGELRTQCHILRWRTQNPMSYTEMENSEPNLIYWDGELRTQSHLLRWRTQNPMSYTEMENSEHNLISYTEMETRNPISWDVLHAAEFACFWMVCIVGPSLKASSWILSWISEVQSIFFLLALATCDHSQQISFPAVGRNVTFKGGSLERRLAILSAFHSNQYS